VKPARENISGNEIEAIKECPKQAAMKGSAALDHEHHPIYFKRRPLCQERMETKPDFTGSERKKFCGRSAPGSFKKLFRRERAKSERRQCGARI